VLLDHSKFIVRSKSKMLSSKKEYDIIDFDDGSPLGTAKDVTGFLGSLLGSVKIEVRDAADNNVVFSVGRSGLIFKKDQVVDAKDQPVGQIKSKKFSLSGGYHVYDKDGKHIAEIQGNMFKAEYKFVTPDRVGDLGTVSRTWGGLTKSFLTGNDSFGVQIDPAYAGNAPMKMLMLGTTIALESILKKGESSSSSSSSGGGE
jgi:uncharacterized protein YxjI